MNILSISAEKANYVPKKVYATSVSPGGNNPTDWTAIEIATVILNRKIFSAIPIELSIGVFDAKRTGNTAMFDRGMESFNNLIGSTLLKLQSEAEEGSLMLKLINERLDEFIKEFGDPIPNYIPFIPPSTGAVTFGGYAQLNMPNATPTPPAPTPPEAEYNYNLAETLIKKSSAQFAAMGELLAKKAEELLWEENK